MKAEVPVTAGAGGDAMPLCVVSPFAVLLDSLVGCYAKVRDRKAACRLSDFWIGAEVATDDYYVHDCSLCN